MSRSSRRFIRFLLFYALVLGFSFLLREWFGGISMDGFSFLRIKGREVSDETFVGRRVPLYYSRLGDGESRLPAVVWIVEDGAFPENLHDDPRPGWVIPLQKRGADLAVSTQIAYVEQILKQEGVESAHMVAQGLGAAVALGVREDGGIDPLSLIMIEPDGLLEYELLGDPVINRSVRVMEWLVCAGVRYGIPFSWVLDRRDYLYKRMGRAKLLFQSDLETVRKHALSYRAPVWIKETRVVDGPRGSNALDLHRILPQSSLSVGDAPLNAWELEDFWGKVEGREVPFREQALEERKMAALQPFDQVFDLSFSGKALLWVLVLICLSTIMSEDLACVATGLLVARGSVGFWEATAACFAGIMIGDVGLFAIGRAFGSNVLRHRPFRWFISGKAVVASEAWFERRGPWVIIASRVIPGSRAPIYIAAGILRMSLLQFSLYLAGASLVATPALIFVSSFLGGPILALFEAMEHFSILGIVAVVVATFIAIQIVLPVFSFRSRRIAVGRWRRLTHWEYWPSCFLYPPVVLYIVWLGLRYRAFTLFTLSNPMLECGGMIGESKSRILEHLRNAGVPVADFETLPAGEDLETRLSRVRRFQDAKVPSRYPVVIKPDVGERGAGVTIVRDEASLRAALSGAENGDWIVQRFVEGSEFGVFYQRLPDEKRGQITSITEKIYTAVVGDGVRDLQELILRDNRAVCYADKLLKTHSARLFEVPERGQEVRIVEIGTHARGSLFLDGRHLLTDELERAVDAFASRIPGFHLGRFDLKVPSVDALRQGQELEVIELNLLTSEPSHIYDPRHGVFHAWKSLMAQWEVAFKIGAHYRNRGFHPMRFWKLARNVRIRLFQDA